jgi:hypothetical protein
MESRRQPLRSIYRQIERTRAQISPLGEQAPRQPQGEPGRPGWPYQRKYREESLPRRQDFDPPPPLWN